MFKYFMTKYSYREIELFTYWFITTIKQMETDNKITLYTLDPKYVIYTNDGLRYNMLNNHVCNILSGPYINIYTPIDKNEFISPELSANKILPLKFHYKTVYYSLGCLLEFLLIDHNELEGTKLHSFINRCKHSNPSERRLIL